MDKYYLETSFQFPLFRISYDVAYEQVRKPDGVSYMLLVLINESQDKNVELSVLLNRLGIPNSLHFIFADTIVKLINQEMIMTTDGTYFDRTYFNRYQLKNLKFTPKGKKFFLNESIATGIVKEVKVPVFYNIALNDFELYLDSDLEPRPLMNSAISDEFVNKFTINRNIDDYLNMNKGKKFPTGNSGNESIIIKKEEIITEIVEIDWVNWVAKYDCTIILDGYKLTVKFENDKIQKFFDENYTHQIFNDSIAFKNKFKFESNYSKDLSISDFVEAKIVDILAPSDVSNILRQKSKMFISSGNYISNNSSYQIKSSEITNKYKNACEFIVVDQIDNNYAFILGDFWFENENLGAVKLPLVLKIKLTNEELKEVIIPYLKTLESYSEEAFLELVKVTNVTNDYDNAYRILEGYLTDDYEHNINLLNEIRTKAILNAKISQKYKELLEKNYNEFLDSIDEDSLETFLKITSTIPKFLNFKSNDILKKIFDIIKEPKDKVKVYESLLENGFNKENILIYCNPVSQLLETRDTNEKNLLNLLNFDNLIYKMKEITKIKDYKNYTFDEDKTNGEELTKTYKTAVGLRKEIEFFKSANKELFNDYNNYMKLFGQLNDYFNLLKDAVAHPTKITESLIDKKINSGDYSFVIINLAGLLEYVLKNTYNLDGNLYDMMVEIEKNKTLDQTAIDDLHEFRKNRNAYIHSGEGTTNFTPEDLRRWNRLIFKVKGDGEK